MRASHGVSKDEGFQQAAANGASATLAFETQTQVGLLLRMRHGIFGLLLIGCAHLSGSPLRSGRDDRVG